jgi:predicted outer membrane repeat protein
MKNTIINFGLGTFRCSLLAAAMVAAFAAQGVYAATITVDPIAADSDGVVLDTKCSLREAVISVNKGLDVGDCRAVVTEAYGTNDTINLPAGIYTLTLAGLDETYDPAKLPTDLAAVVNTPDASKGDLDLSNSVTFVGAGSGNTKIQWDPAATSSAGADRIFHVYNAVDLNKALAVGIQGVTLANGKTFEVNVGPGPTLGTNYYLRRAGGALAVGPAAAIVLFDPSIPNQENTAGRGGSKPQGSAIATGTTYAVALVDVIVESNRAQGDGGGIYTAAPLFVTGTTVRNNSALTNGGGIYNETTSGIFASTISGNTAEGGGGFFNVLGWAAETSSVVFFYGVTLSSNTAVVGGGISSHAYSTIAMANSTISGNIGSGSAAGLNIYGSANLNFVTIARNVAGPDSQVQGAGINILNPYMFQPNSLVTLKNVLIEGNKRGWTAGMDAAAISALPSANCGDTNSGVMVTSQGTNLSSDATCIPWLKVATDKNSVDPKIDVLADNGGPTLTHKLLAGSPAMAAATADPDVTEDQRGVARDAVPDIGAYEDTAAVVPPPAPVVPPPAPVVPPAPDTGTSSSSGGGGGCAVSPNADFDAGLLGLLAAAASGLFLRRRREGKAE